MSSSKTQKQISARLDVQEDRLSAMTNLEEGQDPPEGGSRGTEGAQDEHDLKQLLDLTSKRTLIDYRQW